MTKKTAVNILILVIIVALGIVAYFMFFSGEGDQQTDGSSTEGLPVVSNFFPESEDSSSNTIDRDEPSEPTSDTDHQDIPRLRQISENPVAGFIVFNEESTTTVPGLPSEDESEQEDDTNDEGDSEGGDDSENEESEQQMTEVLESETFYRFVNRSNGNIIEARSKNLSRTRITNTTIPKVYNTDFINKDNIIFQYLEDDSEQIKTSLIKLISDEETEESTSTTTEEVANEQNNKFKEVNNTFLSDNIRNVLTADNGLVLYFVKNANDFLNGYVFDAEVPEISPNLVVESEITEVNPSWRGDNNIFLGTKPSLNGDNFLFRHNTDTGGRTKILDSGPGFSYLPDRNLEYVLFSEENNIGFITYAHEIESGQQYAINLNTLPGDKCVWSRENDYVVYCATPNESIDSDDLISWYRGEVSFNDLLYRTNIITGTQELIGGFDGEFDVIKPALSEDDEYFVFVNKKDLSLWSLKLSDN